MYILIYIQRKKNMLTIFRVFHLIFLILLTHFGNAFQIIFDVGVKIIDTILYSYACYFV